MNSVTTNNNKPFFLSTQCQENMAIYNKNQQQSSILDIDSGYFQKNKRSMGTLNMVDYVKMYGLYIG